MIRPLLRYKMLWKDRKKRETQVKILMYIVNIFMFTVGIFYSMFFYQVSKPMLIINSYFLIINCYLYYLLESDNMVEFSNLVLMTLWLFMICSVYFIGWGYGFQQYIFSILCCFFLPFYLPENQKRKRYHRVGIGFLVIVSYLVLFYLCNFTNLELGYSGSPEKMKIIYALNTFISAVAVMTFSVFATAVGVDDRKKLTRKADFDQLTGLYNRYAINQIIENKAKENLNFYIAIADIDYFKSINDKYGHDIGDEALKKTAKIFTKYSKNIYQVGRWGGEEFLFIANDKITYNEFVNYLDEIRKEFKKTTFKLLKENVKFTISIGSSSSSKNKSISSIIKKADDNLYEAKETGRNKVIG